MVSSLGDCQTHEQAHGAAVDERCLQDVDDDRQVPSGRLMGDVAHLFVEVQVDLAGSAQ